MEGNWVTGQTEAERGCSSVLIGEQGDTESQGQRRIQKVVFAERMGYKVNKTWLKEPRTELAGNRNIYSKSAERQALACASLL